MEKYLVASSGDNLESKVSGRFGHSAFFIMVDPNTMEYESFPGIDPKDSGLNVGKYFNRGVTKVLVGNIGPSTFNEITSAGFKIYLCRNLKVSEAVIKVKNDEIKPMDQPTLDDSIHSASQKKITGRGGGRGMGGGRMNRGFGRR
jgi:predicted Fe-Mo cluster-binding NifX family protein